MVISSRDRAASRSVTALASFLNALPRGPWGGGEVWGEQEVKRVVKRR